MGFIIVLVVVGVVFASVIIAKENITHATYPEKHEIDYTRITMSEPNEYHTFEVHFKNGEVKLYRAHRTSDHGKLFAKYLK